MELAELQGKGPEVGKGSAGWRNNRWVWLDLLGENVRGPSRGPS